ncbi:9e6e13ce-4a85-4376-b594-61e473f0c496 [Sclerotinia trifoliorum]|uniref:9e6e13ce-4a85-4376-b594-61e473f0c496 n=1 Tax=Sclerotinia trifoliorum TaxID=28548 RepID=A0A8H2VMN9_9HELO|nr:9e6e13ce-4a85-4376-b594-61e473f0c496 [Sclerotinia trifoliorum]
MCGRYALHLRPSEVRQYLENENMPVWEAPDDEGIGAPRQSYNFAPGYHGIVYRADVPDWGAGPRLHKEAGADGTEERVTESEAPKTEATEQEEHANEAVRYKLQSMKWGLIPFWTKRNPDYGSMMKTINCRDDSLIENRGMWNTMKQKKRCVVVAEGFYEWLKKGKEKVPHYIKRKDGQLMCMAGLWDVVQYEGSDEKHYTYTIITTSSNKQLNFLHDRMPVILDNGSEDVRTWLDPKRSSWSKELQSLLKPYEGDLEVYPVSKEVGKVGNDSPNFIVPVASTENKSNIANFFAKGGKKDVKASSKASDAPKKSKEEDTKHTPIKEESTNRDDRKTIDHDGSEDNSPLPVPKKENRQGIKHELDGVDIGEPPKKSRRTSASPQKVSPPVASTRKTRSATSNNYGSPKKSSDQKKGSQKITNFFSK